MGTVPEEDEEEEEEVVVVEEEEKVEIRAQIAVLLCREGERERVESGHALIVSHRAAMMTSVCMT